MFFTDSTICVPFAIFYLFPWVVCESAPAWEREIGRAQESVAVTKRLRRLHILGGPSHII